MKNIVLCFDRARDHPGPRDATNAEALLRLLDESDEQITWYHPGTRVPASGRLARLRWREAAVDDARATIAEAYEFLVDCWEPGDRIFMFGVSRGAYCAHALTRLLGTVGVLPDLMDYVLAAYALPRTRRSPQDWRRVTLLAAQLAGHREISVPVQFLGLWDMVAVPARQATHEPLSNLVAGRHAVAVDGSLVRSGGHLVSSPDCVDEVWFRGAHCDVAGGPGACRPLSEIALDWMLDGAVRAGVAMREGGRCDAPAPSEFDALAGSARTISLRRPPASPLVHASVDIYLRAHPEYWRRLPAQVVWADMDWLARSERLVHSEAPAAPAKTAALAAAAS